MLTLIFIYLLRMESFHKESIDCFSSLSPSLEQGVICDVLRYLVPFLQFKKREKHPWRSVTFSMDVFHVFKIVHTIPNRATHHI